MYCGKAKEFKIHTSEEYKKKFDKMNTLIIFIFRIKRWQHFRFTDPNRNKCMV